MTNKEISYILEAYQQVYELDEGKKEFPHKKVDRQVYDAMDSGETAGDSGNRAKETRDYARADRMRSVAAKHGGKSRVREEIDLYDIILSHLVAEGYADTNESALAIMANMSEEWRESIIEEVLDERNRGEQGMSDREVTRRRNLGGSVRSRVSASSLGDHGPQSAIQKFHKTKANQRRAIHKSGRYTRGDTGESGGQGRYQANKDHTDGYPSITKRGDGPY